MKSTSVGFPLLGTDPIIPLSEPNAFLTAEWMLPRRKIGLIPKIKGKECKAAARDSVKKIHTKFKFLEETEKILQ